MSVPKITVAVLTCNRPSTLRHTLRSVLDQRGVDFGVTVMDNASTDDTPEVVRREFPDPRLTYVRNEQNIGIYRNWNRAVSINRSRYLSIFHDDDIMLPGFLAATAAALDAHPTAGFAITQA